MYKKILIIVYIYNMDKDEKDVTFKISNNIYQSIKASIYAYNANIHNIHICKRKSGFIKFFFFLFCMCLTRSNSKNNHTIYCV